MHKKQIWEFVLTYLLVDRGSRFNEKSFTGSMIRQLAAHYNWTYRQLLTSLREGIEMTQPPEPMKERILGIVTELEGELEIETQLRKDPAPESRQQIRGADLYAFIELHLMGKAVHETIPGDPLSALAGRTVRELQRDHPEILLRLLKVLQSRPDVVRRLAGRLSVDRLEQLATAFLVLSLPPEKGRQAELHAAIARWSDRATDRREYFAAVLDAVIRGELIDLERIVAGRQKHAVSEPTTGSVAEPSLIASYLTWFLTVAAPLDPQEKTLYLSLLEGLIADSPQAVGRYLTGMIKEPSLCAAFIHLTPWRLIRKAMAAMAGFTDARQYVVILEGVFRPETPAARCCPADFVKVVIDVLSERQRGDGEEFLKTAFGRLVARIGDAAARKRAVDALEKIVSARGSGLRSIAAHYRNTTNLVLTDDKAPKEKILGVVTELEGEFDMETQLRKEPAPESLRQMRGADLYAFLELHLLGEAVHETIPGDPLSAIAGRTVRELQRDHPEILLRLLKILQSRPDAVQRVAGRLSTDRVEQLATAFLDISLPSEKGKQAELHEAITRWADRAPDRRRYFAAVLDAVVRGELIDFERIVAGRQKRAVTEPTTGSVAEPLQIASYLTWFLTVAPLDPREKTLYLSLLEALIADSTQAIGQYLINMINEPSLCAAFVHLTPWRLIQKVLAAMAGFTDAKRYVAILEGVFRPGTPAARCGPADFVRIVIDVLSEQQHADGEGFLKTAFGRLVARTGDAAARERAVDALEKILSTKGASLRSIATYYRDTTNLVSTGDKASADTQTPEETAVLAYLKGNYPASPTSLPALKRALEVMILHTPEKLYWFIAAHLDHSSMAEKLIALLSEPFQARLFHLLLPRHFGRAQRYVDLLRNAAYGSGSFDSSDEVNQRIWQGVFTYLLETGLRVFDERAFVRRIIEFLAEKKKDTDSAPFYADLGRQLAADIQTSTRADHQALIRIVSEAAQKTRLSESVPPSPQTQPAGAASVLNDYDEETPWDEEIYVANAGMVIAAPHLPRLFELLGLTEQSRFTSREAAERGVHLLQYMVDERTSTPEYRLVLNKILCGVKPGIPIIREIEITDKETEAITGMMTAMIQNWKIIGNTSISGFRESFLQRKARLTRKNDAWHLQVEERAFDMLLDQIPWSFSTIKYSWMDRVIFVKWRE